MQQQPDDTQADARAGPIRVLQVVWHLSVGGIEQWLLHMLSHIDRDSFEIDVMVTDDTRCGYYDEIEALGYGIHKLPPSTTRTHARDFAKFVNRYGPFACRPAYRSRYAVGATGGRTGSHRA